MFLLKAAAGYKGVGVPSGGQTGTAGFLKAAGTGIPKGCQHRVIAAPHGQWLSESKCCAARVKICLSFPGCHRVW